LEAEVQSLPLLNILLLQEAAEGTAEVVEAVEQVAIAQT
jgi:hypothetical protein